MTNIRRHFEPGAIYFVTVVSHKRIPILSLEKSINLLLLTIEYFKIPLDYKILAYCIIPEHFHLLIQPFGKYNLSYLMQMLKGSFARRLNKISNSTGHVWQKRFFDTGIRNETMLFQKMEYIHNNPLKHGLTTDLNQYMYSSYQHYFNKKNSILTIDNLSTR